MALRNVIGGTGGNRKAKLKYREHYFYDAKKPHPHFTATGNSQVLVKFSAEKGSYISQKLLVKVLPFHT